MNVFLFRLALVSSVLVPVTSALAADLEPPPPVDDLRPATYDWTGISAGAFGSANAVDGNYDASPICGCVATDIEMSGIGYGFGVRAGYDYQWNNFVLGAIGDWQFGIGNLATNDAPAEDTYLKMNNLATARARVGWADDNTLLYATGGFAAAEMEFGGAVGPAGVDDSEAQWALGWTVGGGIEHAITDAISVSLEYLYINLEGTTHALSDGAGSGGDVDMEYNDIHTVRAGINYRFSL